MIERGARGGRWRGLADMLPSARIDAHKGLRLLSGGRRVVSPSPDNTENRPGAWQRPPQKPVNWFRLVKKINDFPTIKEDPAPMLSDDELRLLTSLLSNPLEPEVAVAWTSTCWSVLSASAEVLASLKAQHLAIRGLREVLNAASQANNFQSASWGSGSSYGALLIPTVTSFRSLERAHWSGSRLTAASCEAIGILLRSGSLPLVSDISLAHNAIGDAGTAALFSTLRADALPRLEWLSLARCKVGDAGLTSLAGALGRGANGRSNLGVESARGAPAHPKTQSCSRRCPSGVAGAQAAVQYLRPCRRRRARRVRAPRRAAGSQAALPQRQPAG